MSDLFNRRTVISIITGTIILIITNASVWFTPGVDDRWAIRICAVVLVLLASVSGILAGAMIPIAACLFTGVVFQKPEAFLEMILLLVTGVSLGHYSEKLGVGHGRFSGIFMIDYLMIGTGASFISWLCVRPLAVLYMNGVDLRVSINEGLKEALISIAAKLIICLPLLLVFNYFFRKKQMVEDARREYLYHAGK